MRSFFTLILWVGILGGFRAAVVVLSGAEPSVASISDGSRAIQLSHSGKTFDLSLVVTCPKGWSFVWAPTADYGLVRISRDGTSAKETIVVTAMPLAPDLVGKSSDDVFNKRFLRDFALAWNAKACRRVHDSMWDGVFTLYALPDSITKGTCVVDVESWMMLSDGYRVEFNCYFEKDPTLQTAQQKQRDEELRARYLEILKSVRKDT